MKNGGDSTNHRIGDRSWMLGDRSSGTRKMGEMGKMKERERETREDFGDLWCLGLVSHQNGKVKNIYVVIKG